ncbi:MAG: gluconokinase [Candidatus Promineifilaceae bacterium]|nr:gluconokinase [Candidatus Promineifilaceae bacterium]
MTFVIGLDLGTTSCKALALDVEGAVLAQASAGYELRTGVLGQAVQEPEKIWTVVRGVLQELGEQLDLQMAAGLCLGGAMHSVLPVAADGRPLAPAMTWADSRAAPQAAAIRALADEQSLYERTGCPVQSPYHPARLRWWRMNGAPPETALYVGLKEWALHRLSGVWAYDWTMASTSGLLDIRRREWDEEALGLGHVTASELPPLVAPHEQVGVVTAAAARETGLPQGLPVIAGSHDGGLANLGVGADEPGEVAITVGTSGAIRMVVDVPWLDRQARTWCYLIADGWWLAGGAINNGGLAAQWVREQFYREAGDHWRERMERLVAEAASVPPGAEGVLMLPYLAGERTPHWDAQGRATLHGLDLHHSRAHVARAVLEGVAFCLRDVWLVLEEGLQLPGERRPLRISGGVTASETWVQIIADVLGRPLLTIKEADASTIGAALLGQYGLGLIDDLRLQARDRSLARYGEGAEGNSNGIESSGRLYEPAPERHALYAARHELFQALYRMLEGA